MKRSRGEADVLVTSPTSRWSTVIHFNAHVKALEAAMLDWKNKYDEDVPWEDVNFRGGHTTVNVVVELEEVK